MGLALLAGGFVALVVDGTRSLAGGSLYVTTLGSVLQALWPVAFPALRSAVLSRLPTFVWDPLLVFLLMTPVGVALCGLGAAFIVLSHKLTHSWAIRRNRPARSTRPRSPKTERLANSGKPISIPSERSTSPREEANHVHIRLAF